MATEHLPSNRQTGLGSLEVPIKAEFSSVSEKGSDPLRRSKGQTPFRKGSEFADERIWLNHEDELIRAIDQAVRVTAELHGFVAGRVGVMITDDSMIQEINSRHLEHDYPTDVISFTYERHEGLVDGELVVSLSAAHRIATEIGWDWRSELLLYVVHGTLHVCGLDDTEFEQRREMRLAEQMVLARLGIEDACRFGPDGEAFEP